VSGTASLAAGGSAETFLDMASASMLLRNMCGCIQSTACTAHVSLMPKISMLFGGVSEVCRATSGIVWGLQDGRKLLQLKQKTWCAHGSCWAARQPATSPTQPGLQ
jgi:hypothetical protein